MGIKSASKVERITEVTLEHYGDEYITFSEDYSDVAARVIRVSIPDPRAALLDELMEYATPNEDTCPPREVTLQSLIDQLAEQREKLNYNDTVEPLDTRFVLKPEEVSVVTAVLGKGNISYDVDKTVKAAVNPTESEW